MTLAGVILPAASSISSAAEVRCNKARHVSGVQKSLPTLQDRVENGAPITIVAFGSSSTEGTPDIPKQDIYPAVLQRYLQREVVSPVVLINRGKGGETIAHMLARLDRDVIAAKPDLVVWQLGVNDVLVMDGVEAAVADMRIALVRLKAAGIPVVLIDLQVAPMVERDRDTPVMQAAIAEAAKDQQVLHFKRYDVMKSLMASREADMSELVTGDGLHMTAFGHLCTGSLLARQIANGALMRLASGNRSD